MTETVYVCVDPWELLDRMEKFAQEQIEKSNPPPPADGLTATGRDIQKSLEDHEVSNDTPQLRLDSAEIQAKYDPAYRAAMGEAAPPRMHGESLDTYHRRLAGPLQKHSEKYGTVDLGKIGDATVLKHIATDICTDAVASSMRNVGPLRSFATQDAAGRNIRRFVGAPGACWNQFKRPYQFIKSINGQPVF
jgi:hypothetical protein